MKLDGMQLNALADTAKKLQKTKITASKIDISELKLR